MNFKVIKYMSTSILVRVKVPLLQISIELWMPYDIRIKEYLPALINIINQKVATGLLDSHYQFLYSTENHTILNQNYSLKENDICFGDYLLLL